MRFSPIILICLSTIVVTGEKISILYKEKSDVNNKNCRNKNKAFKNVTVSDIMACSSICTSKSDCKSFFYFPTTRRCDGCMLPYDMINVKEKTVHYTTQAKEAVTKSGYHFVGCFSTKCGEKQCSNVWRGGVHANSEKSCLEICEDQFDQISSFGLQGDDCFCDLAYQTNATNCDTRCPGNDLQICGGKGSVSVFVMK